MADYCPGNGCCGTPKYNASPRKAVEEACNGIKLTSEERALIEQHRNAKSKKAQRDKDLKRYDDLMKEVAELRVRLGLEEQ